MIFWRRLRSWLHASLHRSRAESDMDAEFRFHLEARVDDLVRSGLPHEEAFRRARAEFGGLELTKDQCRDARSATLLDSLLQDLRYGFRTLRKSPAFTAIAVLTLALGIGANTAIFSVVNGILLQPLPFPRQSQLLMLWEKDKEGLRSNTSWATFTDWSRQNHSFTGIAAVSLWTPTLVTPHDAENLIGFRVSANFFDLMGLPLLHGRGFLPSEDARGDNFVVVLSHGFWQRRFAGNTRIVGKSIQLGSRLYNVVGILPPSFPSVLSFDPRKTADLYTPLAYDATLPYACRDCRHLRTIARLKDSVSFIQADAEMNQISQNLFQQYPTEYSAPGVALTTLKENLVGDVRPVLWALLGSVGFVLLIACVNVANLLLARYASRQREVAVRSALGAGPARIIRQFLTESLLLSLLGGLFGLVFASSGVSLLQQFHIANLPRLQSIHIDIWTLIFTMAVCGFTTLAFGLFPAFRASRLDPVDALKDGGKNTSGTERHSLRRLLVVSDVALALLLLTGAGLMMKSFVRLLDVNPGFEREDSLTLSLSLWGADAEAAPALSFYQQVLDRVRTLPGVHSAGIVSQLPLAGNLDMYGVHVEGKSSPNPEDDPSADRYSITPGYLAAMRIPLLRGREVQEQDLAASPLVVLVNESAARQFWPSEDPIGKRLRLGDTKGPWRTVVGVVGDVLHRGLDAPHTLQIYLPESQFTDSEVVLVVRSTGSPSLLADSLRSQISAINPHVPISQLATMRDVMSASVANQRFGAVLFALFGFVAVLLAAGGIYGVISYGVAQRTHELGIRAALGAHPSEIVHLILAQGAKLTLLGVATGLLSATALTRFMRSLLFQVSPFDPITLGSAAVLLTLIALLACYLPARRATRIDPMVALRYE